MRVHKGTVEAVIDLTERYREETRDLDGLASMRHPASVRYHCLLDNLAAQVKYELIALMWLGDDQERVRTDFEHLVTESSTHSEENAIEYLTSKQDLCENLREGMRKMEM